MPEFEVRTHRLTVEPHPDADRLECARIGGYLTVVAKEGTQILHVQGPPEGGLHRERRPVRTPEGRGIDV